MKKENAASQTAFFKELEKERYRVNMPRNRFAEHIGLSAGVYYYWERGRNQRDEKVIEIAQNLKWPEEKDIKFLGRAKDRL